MVSGITLSLLANDQVIHLQFLIVIAIYEQQHASPGGKAHLSDVHQEFLDEKKARADELKHTKYALG